MAFVFSIVVFFIDHYSAGGYLISIAYFSFHYHFSENQIVLDICERNPGTRTYSPHIELIWDTGLGTSTVSLKQAISQKIVMRLEDMALAKHQAQRFEWSVIEDKQKVRML